MTQFVLVKEEPPPATRKGNQSAEHLEIAATLQGDPGVWYRVSEEQKTAELAQRIKKGVVAAYKPAGSFEAVSRRVLTEPGSAAYGNGEKSTFTVWARYVGPDDPG